MKNNNNPQLEKLGSVGLLQELITVSQTQISQWGHCCEARPRQHTNESEAEQ